MEPRELARKRRRQRGYRARPSDVTTPSVSIRVIGGQQDGGREWQVKSSAPGFHGSTPTGKWGRAWRKGSETALRRSGGMLQSAPTPGFRRPPVHLIPWRLPRLHGPQSARMGGVTVCGGQWAFIEEPAAAWSPRRRLVSAQCAAANEVGSDGSGGVAGRIDSPVICTDLRILRLGALAARRNPSRTSQWGRVSSQGCFDPEELAECT